ncbi:MAG: N-acetylmuramidase [Rhodopseudomonas sp.]|nr:N-acetylmuramidase [Rhodopseudomonas sp.]
MMDTSFDAILGYEKVYEGGYSNHPADKGGPTMCGVTQRVYDGYRRSKGLNVRAVKQLELDEWKDIFRRQYWDVIQGDRLPVGVDLAVFDGALNSGPYQSALWLQRALVPYYKGEIDGHIGAGTMAAIMAHPDHDALIANMLGRRLGMLQNLGNWNSFGAGWTARISNVLQVAQSWAMGSVGPPPVAAHREGGDAKAYASDVEQPPLDPQAGNMVAGGSGGIGAMLEGVRQQVAQVANGDGFMTKVMIGLTVACAIVAVSGVVYSFWAARKNKQARAAIEGGIVAEVPVIGGGYA